MAIHFDEKVFFKAGAQVIGPFDYEPTVLASTGGSIPQYLFTNVTTAEVNAGKVILPEVTGKSYRILDYGVTARGGAATTVTAILLQDTAGSPVNIATLPVACLTQDETVGPDKANVTGGAAGGGAACTSGKGVKIIKSGSDMTVATSVDVVLFFALV